MKRSEIYFEAQVKSQKLLSNLNHIGFKSEGEAAVIGDLREQLKGIHKILVDYTLDATMDELLHDEWRTPQPDVHIHPALRELLED